MDKMKKITKGPVSDEAKLRGAALYEKHGVNQIVGHTVIREAGKPERVLYQLEDGEEVEI